MWPKWKQNVRGCVSLVRLYEQTHVTQMETRCEGVWFWYCCMSKPMLPKQRQDVRRVVLVLAEPLACIGKHSTCHYLLSTTTTNHSLSTNVALPNISMNIFQGLTKQAMKSIVQSPSPAAQLREFLCNHILQYDVLCCSHCYCEQHAEPLACIGPKFSSRALRLQLHMFHLCVIVCVVFWNSW